MGATTLKISERFIYFPVKNDASKHYIDVYDDEKPLTQFDIELSAEPDYYAFFDAEYFIGHTLTFKSEKFDLSFISCTNSLPEGTGNEELRPKYCFTAQRGWLNDPNGLFFLNGKYHMFYQHNPFSRGWGNMTWGHAVSEDLFNWEYLPSAILPDDFGTIFSGSAIVDSDNVSGLQSGENSPVLLFYTAAGRNNIWSKDRPFTQCMSFSRDGGKTFEKYTKNPVVNHIAGDNRDPKVIKNPDGGYIMALYLDGNEYALLGSENLLVWKEICRVSLPNCSECPDIFTLPLDGDKNNMKWIFWGAASWYAVGSFNGKSFTTEQPAYYTQAGDANYAAQSFDNLVNRRVQITWATHDIPGTPFNQSMCIPCELTLRSTKNGMRLCTKPVKELDKYSSAPVCSEKTFDVWDTFDLDGNLCDVKIISDNPAYEFFIGDKKLTVTGDCVVFNNRVTLVSDTSVLRIVCDKTLSCVFSGNGELMLGINDGSASRKLQINALGKQKIKTECSSLI